MGEDGDVKVSGVRGCAARQVYKGMTKRKSSMIRESVRLRLAEAMETTEDDLKPAQMRGFMEKNVPLGAGPRLLTYVAYLVARMWELMESGQVEELYTLIALAAVFVEQVAIDSGRCQVAWMLTGLQSPCWTATMKNNQRMNDEPFASLADARWMAANLAYLKDLDWFTQRQAAAPKQPAAGAGADGVIPTGKARPKPKPKKRKGDGKGKGKDVPE